MEKILIEGVVIPALSFIVTEIVKRLFSGEDYSFPWLRWLSLCAIGGAIGAVLSASMGMAFGGFGNWAAYGAAVGVLQAVALEPYLNVGGWWAAAAALGWAIVPVAPIFIGVLLSGLLVGTLQAPLLSRNRFLWIALNGLIWPFAVGLGFFVQQGLLEATSRGFVAFVLASAAGTLAGSIATGAFLSTQE